MSLSWPRLRRRVIVLAGLAGVGWVCGAPSLKTYLTYKEHGDFVRISEFLDGKENSGGRAIVRTRPRDRTGLYFSLAVKAASLPDGAKVVVQVIRSTSPEVKTFELEAPRMPARAREMLVGLTGKDWNRPEGKPVAWRVRILDSAGGVIAAEQSFLWEK